MVIKNEQEKFGLRESEWALGLTLALARLFALFTIALQLIAYMYIHTCMRSVCVHTADSLAHVPHVCFVGGAGAPPTETESERESEQKRALAAPMSG